MSNFYRPRLYDTEPVRLTVEKRGLEGLAAGVLTVRRDKSHLMPLDLGLGRNGAKGFTRVKAIPKESAVP